MSEQTEQFQPLYSDQGEHLRHKIFFNPATGEKLEVISIAEKNLGFEGRGRSSGLTSLRDKKEFLRQLHAGWWTKEQEEELPAEMEQREFTFECGDDS